MSRLVTWTVRMPMRSCGFWEEINRMGTTVVVVTHSEEIVARMHKRVITMERGCVISDEIRGGESDEN